MNLSTKNSVFKKASTYFNFKQIFLKKKRTQLALLLPTIVFSLYLVFLIADTIHTYAVDKNFVKNLFVPVLSELEKDKEGFINVLVIGEGGKKHDGGDLSDTMIIASIDTVQKSVVMLSIPRDFWLDTKKFGSSRINEIFRNTKNRLIHQFNLEEEIAKEEATKIFITEVEKITNIEIPYYVRLDFNGFIEVVDYLGGIDIYNKKNIYDETYPDGNWGVELFELKKGDHHLDGATSLKFARSRHGTSDFDRARRQQEVIQAVREKALSLGFLTSPKKISGVLDIINNNFETNLSMSELISLGFVAKDIPKDRLVSAVLNDDWESRGGFLGVPPRVDYGGAFVLIPYSGVGNFERIHIFTNLLFNYRALQFESFEVLNATNRSGLAAKSSKRLQRYGFNIQSTGNAEENLQESELWVYKSGLDLIKLEELIYPIFPIKIVDKIGLYEETDIFATFVIGRDFK